MLQGEFSDEEKALKLNEFCQVYLKGGHSENAYCEDILLVENQKFYFKSERIPDGEKHGSGCVLSSAITANLAKSLSIQQACANAKQYMNQILKSNPNLLAYHFQT